MGVFLDTRSEFGLVRSWQGPLFFLGGHFFEKTRFFMFLEKNGSKKTAIIQTIGKNGILDPIHLFVGTLNAQNGRPRVVPYPFLFCISIFLTLSSCLKLKSGTVTQRHGESKAQT